jgi:hypothetical protein
MNSASPLLLVDVDGVISLFGFDQTEPPEGRLAMVDGLPHWISRAAGARLARLHAAFECVWCTGWEERADEHLPRLLGLPSGWSHLTFPDAPEVAAHWKLSAIETFAGRERPTAWIDDSHDDACHDWAERRPGPTLLVATNPAVGITDAHVDELLSFARAASG